MKKQKKESEDFVNPYSFKFGLAMVILGVVIGAIGGILFFFGMDWGLIALVPAAFLLWRGALKMVVFAGDKDKTPFGFINPYYICGILLIAIGLFLRGLIPIIIFCGAGLYVMSLKTNKKMSSNKKLLLAVFITVGTVGLYVLLMVVLYSPSTITGIFDKEPPQEQETLQSGLTSTASMTQNEYVNKNYNFRLLYPQDWTEEQPDLSYTLAKFSKFAPDSGSYAKITIKQYDNYDEFLTQDEYSEWLEQNKEAYIKNLEDAGLESVKLQNITVNGNSLYAFRYFETTKVLNQITQQYDTFRGEVLSVSIVVNKTKTLGINYITFPEEFDKYLGEASSIIGSFICPFYETDECILNKLRAQGYTDNLDCLVNPDIAVCQDDKRYNAQIYAWNECTTSPYKLLPRISLDSDISYTADSNSNNCDDFFTETGALTSEEIDMYKKICEEIGPNQFEDYATLNGKALEQSGNGEYSAATQTLNEMLEITQNDANVWFLRGKMKGTLGDAVGSISDFDQAIKINPQDGYIYRFRGLSKTSKDIMDYHGALIDFNKAIELLPADGKSYYYRALLKLELGNMRNYKEAVIDFTKALSIGTDDLPEEEKDDYLITIYLGRGIALALSLDCDIAIDDFNKVLKIDTQNEVARDWRQKCLEAEPIQITRIQGSAVLELNSTYEWMS